MRSVLMLVVLGACAGTTTDEGETADPYANTETVGWDCAAETSPYAWLPADDAYWPEGWVAHGTVDAGFVVKSFDVGLYATTALEKDCDPRVGLEVMLWVSSESPADYDSAASPMNVPFQVSASAVGTLAPVDGSDAVDVITVTLDEPLLVEQAGTLYVGYRNNGAGTATAFGCMALCEGTGEQVHWQHDPDGATDATLNESTSSDHLMIAAELGRP